MSDDFAQLIRELDDCAKRGIWSDKFTMSTATRARDALRTLRDERDEFRDALATAAGKQMVERNRLTAERDAAQRAHKSAAEQVRYLKVSREQCQSEVERWKALCRDAMLELDNTVTRQAISAALGEQP